MDSEARKLDMFFLPFMSPGHMIPMVDMARLFAARGVNVTIIITPNNALLFQNSIDRDIQSGHQIQLHILKFPSAEVGLPEGIENFDAITSSDMSPKLFHAISLLQQPIHQLFQQRRPDCIVSDMFFPWTYDVAAQLGIPRLVFHGTSFFALCVTDTIDLHVPLQNEQSSEEEIFLLPGLPDPIEMRRSQLHNNFRTPNSFERTFFDQVRETDAKSYGILVNSFYELEPAYAEHYRNAMGRKAWHVGPVSLSVNRDTIDKADRGNNAVIMADAYDCLSWLDSKPNESVLYISFGSLSRFPTSQLLEIASGLEASGHPFIWVVRTDEETSKDWLPKGFEERMMEGEKKGMIIRGWAPQLLILDHPAIGGFMTHCGWNSVLEGVTTGVPMITWPLSAEQFSNEKLVTQILKIGVGVGNLQWSLWTEIGKVVVKREKIEKAVTRLMNGGDEAEGIRERARELGKLGRRTVEDGGSSCMNLTALIDQLTSTVAVAPQKSRLDDSDGV